VLDLAGMIVKLTPQGIRETADQLKQFTREAGKAEDANSELAKSNGAAANAMYEFGAKVDMVSGGPLTLLKGAMLALPIAYVGKQIFDLGVGIIETGAKFEVLQKQLQATMGSESAAADAMKWIEDFATSTPLQVEQVTESFNMLKAIGIDPMNGSLQAMVDATSFTAQGYEGLISVTRQMGQAWAKERLSGEEVLRLRERMIPVYDLLADKMGKTTTQIAEMAEKGLLGRKEIKLLMEAMGEKYAGAAALQMDTLTGAISNLQDAWTFAQREIANAGAMDAVREGIEALIKSIEDLTASGDFERIGESFGEILEAAADALPSVVESFEKLLKILPTVLKHVDEIAKALAIMWAADKAQVLLGVLSKFAPALTGAAGAAWGLYGAIGAVVGYGLAEWFDTWNRSLGGVSGEKIHAFGQALRDVFGDQGSAVLANFGDESWDQTQRIVAAVTYLEDEIIAKGKGAGTQWDALAAVYQAAMGTMKETTITVTPEIVKGTDDVGNAAEKTKKKVKDFWTAFKIGPDLAPQMMVFGEMTGKAQKMGLSLDAAGKGAKSFGGNVQKVLQSVAPAPPLFNATADAVGQAAERMQAFRAAFQSQDWTANDLLHGLELVKIESKDAEEAIRELGIETGDVKVTWETVEKVAAKLGRNVEDVAQAMGFAKNGTQQFTTELEKLNAAALAFSEEFQQSIVDLFGGTFQKLLSGEFESLGEFIGEWFSNFGQMAGEMIINQLVSAMFSKETTLTDAFDSLFGEGGALSGAKGVVAGAGLMFAGNQIGGAEGALTGAVGGAIAGTSISPGIGTIVGAVIGGVVGYLGGKGQDKPIINVQRIGVGSAWQGGAAGVSTQNAGMGAEEDRLLSLGIAATYRAINTQWRDLIRGFRDLELFDFLLEMPEIIDQSFEMSAEAFQQWLAEDKLPTDFLSTYAHALERGLANLGFNHEMFSQLYAEMIDMTGSERMEGLSHVINGLRQVNELLEMDFKGLEARAGENFMDEFLRFTQEAGEQMEVLTAGWDDMSIMERAADLENIGTVFQNVTQATLQMLRSLDSMAQQLTNQFDALTEQFTTRGMSDEQLWSHLESRYDYYANLLENTDDPNLIMEYTQRMIQILSQASGMISDEDWTRQAGTTGQTWQEWFISMTEGAQAAADAALEEQRARVQAVYDELYLQLDSTTDRFYTLAGGMTETTDVLADLDTALINFGGALDILTGVLVNIPALGGNEIGKAASASALAGGGSGGVGGGVMHLTIEAPEPPIVRVNINGSLAALQPFVEAIVERRSIAIERQIRSAIS